jgi:hypothetical protein
MHLVATENFNTALTPAPCNRQIFRSITTGEQRICINSHSPSTINAEIKP